MVLAGLTRLGRWLLVVTQLLLLVAPAGAVGWGATTHCPCGMASGCCCLRHAQAPGDCGVRGMTPAPCSMRAAQPLENRSSPPEPDLQDRLGVLRDVGAGFDPTPVATVADQADRPPAALSPPPEVPPPRSSVRIG